ncbi:hypothetical protein [Chitinophaga sp. XS-30]|uniref:hypothetical protein n=1 Tax=Chitinophaga sp. XS-30 TaxID=2604421 RepID=UPI0011DDBCE2|nr:hypothetical protein [Chitinophaga sp. XS-30]QEH42307.1 hypothetical protein FW415_16080 [Chitinophaga sp. XS-30]
MPLYPYASGPSVPPTQSFVFPTDLGCLYIIEFYSSIGRFSDDPILHNDGLIYEINITRSYLERPPNKGERKFDNLVEPTIREILNNFIQAGGILPVYFYVCENGDEKENARSRLFAERWYLQSTLEGWILYNFELKEDQADPSPWFLGLLIHEDHPNAGTFSQCFENFITREITQGKVIQTSRV